MRSNKEIAAEARRRSAALREQKRKKKRLIYTISAAAACLAPAVGLSFIIPVITDTAPTDADGLYTAAMFVGGAAGGYVLMWVLGFALGGLVMFLYMRKSGKD